MSILSVIEIVLEARPVKVRFRNYSQEQKQFLDKKISSLLKAGILYHNWNYSWAWSPILVPKHGADHFYFNVYLRLD